MPGTARVSSSLATPSAGLPRTGGGGGMPTTRCNGMTAFVTVAPELLAQMAP